MKASEIIKIQDTIDRLQFQIKGLDEQIRDSRLDMELLYVKLANCSVKYGRTRNEVEIASDPRFPGLLASLVKIL